MLVNLIIFELRYIELWILEACGPVFVVRKVQLSSEVVYNTLEISYARLFYTKVVYNGVLRLLYKFRNLWTCNLSTPKIRSRVVAVGRLFGRCFEGNDSASHMIALCVICMCLYEYVSEVMIFEYVVYLWIILRSSSCIVFWGK
jgi:hypothetical protein